jgi:release factor glutamine methyltransferase
MQTASTSSPVQTWTIRSLLEWASGQLSQQDFDDPRANSEQLLSYLSGQSRTDLYMNYDRPFPDFDFAAFRTLLLRRLAHEPLQYIVGETDFMGLPVYVNPAVLIPRPETEQLVEKALEVIRESPKDRVEVLDVGTGSGNIAIAIASFAPSAVITAIDASSDALVVAARNVKRHNLTSISLAQADIFLDVLPGRKFDVIVSNPPYISLEEMQRVPSEVRDYEPRIATTDEGDGLVCIRRVFQFAAERLVHDGTLLMEISYEQSAVTRTIAGSRGFSTVHVFDDYAGIPRVVLARK